MKLWIALTGILLAGCGGSSRGPEPAPKDPTYAWPNPPPAPREEPEPSRIVVQHVLIAFAGAAQAPATVTRTRAEAEAFAKEILNRVNKGEDIRELAKAHSTDPGGGMYTLVNHGQAAGRGEIRRAQFIKPFSDTAFKLKVGEAGLVDYDPGAAPYGWHVIKRLE